MWDQISLFMFLKIFPYFWNFFYINIHENANYAKWIIYISYDIGINALCLSFNLVPILVVYDK